MARETSNLTEPLDPELEAGDDATLGSMETTNLERIPNPADYDEELADARLVQQGADELVPGTAAHQVEREAVEPLQGSTGNAVPDPRGGEGDRQAAAGGTVTGDPDNPNNVDTSKVPAGYEEEE